MSICKTMIFRNKRSKLTGNNKTKSSFAGFTKSRSHKCFRRCRCGWIRNYTWLDMWLDMESAQGARLRRLERALEEPVRLERGPVAREASHALHAQRQAAGDGLPRPRH